MTGGPGYRGDAESNRSTSPRTGCQWRLLPREFPPCGTVYYYFQAWQNSGVWVCLTSSALRAGPSSCRTGSAGASSVLGPNPKVDDAIRQSITEEEKRQIRKHLKIPFYSDFKFKFQGIGRPVDETTEKPTFEGENGKKFWVIPMSS